MGAAVGAVVGGPKGLQTAMNQARMPPTATGLTGPGYYSGEAGAKLAEDKKWTLERLAKVRRLASGDIRDEDRNYPTEGPPQPFRALQSVSEDARHFMRSRFYERQWRQRTIEQALAALEDYDKTGILMTLF